MKRKIHWEDVWNYQQGTLRYRDKNSSEEKEAAQGRMLWMACVTLISIISVPALGMIFKWFDSVGQVFGSLLLGNMVLWIAGAKLYPWISRNWHNQRVRRASIASLEIGTLEEAPAREWFEQSTVAQQQELMREYPKEKAWDLADPKVLFWLGWKFKQNKIQPAVKASETMNVKSVQYKSRNLR